MKMFCQDCGAKLNDGEKYCFKCGARQAHAAETAPTEVAISGTSPVQNKTADSAISQTASSQTAAAEAHPSERDREQSRAARKTAVTTCLCTAAVIAAIFLLYSLVKAMIG